MSEENESQTKQNNPTNQTEIPQQITEEKYNITKLKYEEEIDDLKQTLKQYEEGYNQSLNLLKEYFTFANYFPLRGEFFCCGKIEKSSITGESYTMNFSSTFVDVPKVMICALYPKIIRVDNAFLTVSRTGFVLRCDKGLPILADGSFFFWMAYLPKKPKTVKIIELIELMKGVKVVTEKELESKITKYLKKYDVNDEDSLGRTLLYCACEKSYRYLVEFLISKGANVNCCDENRYSPLHKALTADEINVDIVKLLLENGISIKRSFKLLGTS